MLILTAQNVSGLAEYSNYDVWIGINDVCLWRGQVYGHQRSAGAADLLRLIASTFEEASAVNLEKESKKPRRTKARRK